MTPTRDRAPAASAMGGIFLLIAVALGCATEPTQLGEARAAFDRVAARADVRQRAGVELHDARTAIELAESTWESEGNFDEAVHLAYLATRRAELAQLAAERRELEEQIDRSPRQRAARRLAEAERVAASMAVGTISAQSAGGLDELLKELSLKPDERGVVTLGDVHFGFDAANLKNDADPRYDQLSGFLAEQPERRLLIEGHTDDTGVLEYNFDLSRRRADAVKSRLVQSGVAPERILTVGYGPVYPVASNSTPTGRAANRRVAIVVLASGDDL